MKKALPLSLILFSGLPGCGKTTLARQLARRLALPIFTKDRVQRRLRDSGLPAQGALAGYELILDLADEHLALGVSVILDAVFPRSGFRDEAAAIARQHQAAFHPVHCICSDEALWRSRMEQRVQYVPGWTPAGWEEVERLRPEFEPWPPPVLTLDALNTPAVNFKHLLDHLLI